jgi:DNA-binding transcriptional MerR regulator
MAVCTHCGTLNKDELKYCKNCGASLATPAPLTCSRCGNRNPTPSVFCNRCGERLVNDTTKAKAAAAPAEQPTKTNHISASQASHTPEKTARTEPHKDDQTVPDWLSRLYGSTPGQVQLTPTHELLRMANALGVDVDYSTLRFWQKRGLVPKPVRGPVSTGLGTRGYYDATLMDRLTFIRQVQKNHAMGLENIREELDRIDKKIAHAGPASAAAAYQERLAELESRRDNESKKTIVAMIGKALGIPQEEIATVVVRKKDGQTIRLLAEKAVAEPVER